MFVVGLLTGGVLSGLMLGVASGLFAPLPAVWRYGAVLGVALLGLLREAGAVRIPLPQNTRQVPQDVLQRDLLRGAMQFGFELGTGVRTFVSATAPYVLAAALLLAGGRLHLAVLAGLGFGAGRATTPLVRRASGAAADWDIRLHARLRTITVAGCAAMAAALAVVLR